MSCGFCPMPAFAAERTWAKSTIRVEQLGTQHPCDLTQRRCLGQIFFVVARTPILGRFNLSGSLIRGPDPPVHLAGVIVKATGDEVLGLKLLSPLYEAVNEWCPGANQGYPFGKANEPWLFKPKYVVKGTPLSLKAINPVGVP